MVGGHVTGLAPKGEHLVLRVCNKPAEETPCDIIFVAVPAGSDVQLGDEVWWQAGTVYCSRKDAFSDADIPKRGYSYGFHHL